MVHQNQKKHDEGKSGFNPVVAAVTGAVVGAGVAVAGAIALKDKKNRDKVKGVLNNVKDKATGYVEDIRKQLQDKKNEAEEKLAEGKEKVKKVEDAVKS